MIPLLHRAAVRLFDRALADNLRNIEELLALAPPSDLLDLGCDDGLNSIRFARAARARSIAGVEAVPERADLARGRGVDVVVGDLNEPLPFDDDRFGAVVSNQVLEHLVDTDRFVSEIARVLAPGGIAVLSTENLAGWHNVASLALGWQPFSLANVSAPSGSLGNPLALHRGRPHPHASWEHRRVFAHRGLLELLAVHGLRVERVLGAGYYPLPSRLGRVDPRHAAFLAVAARTIAA